jgi:NAD(P)-dependent dehydrogenase (short-subunit alcohol dehydrogenase family)
MSRYYFITGASSGFGAALATAVLERGDRAVLAARRFAPIDAIARAYPDTALAVELDVTDPSSRVRAVAAALDRFGRIDVLANIAGRGSLGSAEESPDEQLRELFELNFFAAVEMTRLVLPAMRAQGSGHILNLAGIAGIVAFRAMAPYCASKFALEGWSEALRDEVKPLGIAVTIVEPGAFRTDFVGERTLRAADAIDAYRPIIAPVEKFVLGSAGRQPGDPAKAALAMIALVESAEAPLRLILGADAIAVWEKKLAAMQSEADAWRDTSTNTRFERVATPPVTG